MLDPTEVYGRWADSRYNKKYPDNGEDKPAPTFRASSMGTCRRAQLWKKMGLKGRPLSDEKRRFLYMRTLLHDDYVRAMRWGGLAVATEVDVSAGLPPGHSGHLDLLLHDGEECGCGMAGRGNLQIRMAEALKAGTKEAFAALRIHQWEIQDVKTTHPNILNYTANLPRAHNVLQVKTYGEGFWRMTGIQAKLSVTYIPMGEGKPLYCPVEAEYPANDVLQECVTLDRLEADREDPGPLPLVHKVKKEGRHQVVFLVQPWECSEQYCPYCRYEEGQLCEPTEPVNATGDRVAYQELDGTWTYIKKWADKVNVTIPHGFKVEAGPRPKEEPK